MSFTLYLNHDIIASLIMIINTFKLTKIFLQNSYIRRRRGGGGRFNEIKWYTYLLDLKKENRFHTCGAQTHCARGFRRQSRAEDINCLVIRHLRCIRVLKNKMCVGSRRRTAIHFVVCYVNGVRGKKSEKSISGRHNDPRGAVWFGCFFFFFWT